MKRMMLAALLLTSPAWAEETLDTVLADLQLKEIAEIKNYLARNPGAADAEEAEARLVGGLLESGQKAEALPYLVKQYNAAASAEDPDLRILFGGILPGLVDAYAATGQRAEAEKLIEDARAKFKGHEMADRIADALDGLQASLKKPTLGDRMDIAFEALDGRKVNLAEMKDKVVLVDFWATWCGPCKFELPHLLAAYNKHHDDGFEIIGISLDDDRERLESFIQERGMTWPQHFDGNGWQNELAAQFGIQSIPATFLVGKDGTIVATDLRGPALEKKVAELLAN